MSTLYLYIYFFLFKALLYDVLYELSLLSLFLQNRTTNILTADSAIDQTIRIISTLSQKPDEDGISRTYGTRNTVFGLKPK